MDQWRAPLIFFHVFIIKWKDFNFYILKKRKGEDMNTSDKCLEC